MNETFRVLFIYTWLYKERGPALLGPRPLPARHAPGGFNHVVIYFSRRRKGDFAPVEQWRPALLRYATMVAASRGYSSSTVSPRPPQSVK